MADLSDEALLRELEPVVVRLLERHLATARDWLPHEWVPWSRGRDFGGPQGLAWRPEQSAVEPAVQAALTLNLLTEENLPSYHHEWLRRVGEDGAWGEWVRRWTAEEARHAMALRDYLIVSRAVDPQALERERMAAAQAGWTSGRKGLLQTLVYAALQERATRIAHRNAGRACGDDVGERLLRRIAADENLHMVFYRDLVAEALALAPAATLDAIADEAEHFEMPGASLPYFLQRSLAMALAGIYDVRAYRDQVLLPLLRHWGVLPLTLDPLSDGTARPSLVALLGRLEAKAERLEARRARLDGQCGSARP